jgi:hypothetical protein
LPQPGRTTLAVAMITAGLLASGAAMALAHRPNHDPAAPKAPTQLVATPGDGSVSLQWAASTDNVGVVGYDVYRSGKLVASPTATSYTDTGLTDGTAYGYAVDAYDAAGNRSALSAAVAATPTATASAPSSGSGSGYFSTLPSGASGLPQSDSTCASQVPVSSWEPRPDNVTADQSVPSGTVSWSNASSQLYWSKWIAKRNLVTGNYKGTTDEIFRWAACKWGIDEDVLRAVAVQESDWHESAQGDYANGSYHSFGITQIRNTSADGSPDWGGYSDTLNETALNVDFYSAYIRSCYDGDFYDGGSWLYNGKTISQVIAANGADYALWGCVGSWFSGGWYDSGAQTYIAGVKQSYSAKTWLTY